MKPLDTAARLRDLLAETLGLSPERRDALNAETPLFGAMPELDSMAVAGVLTEIEDRFGIVIEDDDVDGELFATFGNLLSFIDAKLAKRS